MKKIFSLFVAALFSASMMADDTYTVVGGNADIFGTAWAETLAANDMTLDGSVYKLVKEGVSLPKGSQDYKIVKNHSWTVSYPQTGNASFEIETAGKYDITFKLDLSASPEYSVEAVLKEEQEVVPSIAMHGNFSGSWKDSEEFTLAGDKKTASLKLTLAENPGYEFGMRIGGSGNWTSNGASFTRQANSHAITNGSGNLKLAADLAGEYTFTWTFETNTLAVTYPEGQVEEAKFYITGDSAFVTDAGFPGKAWNPSAIKSTSDTLKLNLKANVDYTLKVSVNGTWEGENNVKGYNELSEKTDGLLDSGDDHNIGFKLNTASEVQVIYIAGTPEVFKVVGDFYTEPVVLPAKFYVTGDSALVVDAGLEKEKAWSMDAIKAEEDTILLSLKGNQEYHMQVLDGEAWKGYSDLTVKPLGVSAGGEYGNDIIFKLNEDGNLMVIYKSGELFKIDGDFYVAPETAHFYVTGDSALVVDAGLDKAKAWNPDAIKSTGDTLKLQLKADVDYTLKVSVNGTWVGENNVKGYNELTEKTDGLVDLGDDHNIGFTLNTASEVQVIYIAGTPEVFKVVGDFYTEPVVLPAKFYVTGDSALVVDAGLEKEKAWSMDAIKAEEDTLLLSLKGNQEYHMQVLDGEAWKGYSDLTVKPLGVSAGGEYGNDIIFKLNEDGNLMVIYKSGELFKIVGDFYVDPETAHFYVTGDSAFVVDAGLDKAKAWNPDAIKSMSDTLKLNLKAGQPYMLKVTKNGTWEGADNVKGYDELTEKTKGLNRGTGDDENNIAFTLNINTLVYIVYSEGEVNIFEVIGDFYYPAQKYEDGYYLVGKFRGVEAWEPAGERMLAVNTGAEGEYYLNVELAVDDELKVVKSESDELTWYPDGMDNAYKVDDAHAGQKVIYFRPAGNDDWKAFHEGGFFYIEANPTAIDNAEVDAKAVKMIENGMLIIRRDGKTYNVLGTMVK